MGQTSLNRLMPVVSAICCIIAIAIFYYGLLYTFAPHYYGDFSAYQYKVVVRSTYFDATTVGIANGADAHVSEDVYYTNDYKIRERKNSSNYPLGFIVRAPAELVKGNDGNYRLYSSSYTEIYYFPSASIDITVFKQTDGKVVFSSTMTLAVLNNY